MSSHQRQMAAFIACIAENLPPMDPEVMQGWIENPGALQKFMAGLTPAPYNPVWRTVRLGMAPNDYERVFERATGQGLTVIERQLIEEVPVASGHYDLDLVCCRVSDLGDFPGGATNADVRVAMGQRGLNYCPGEVALALKLWRFTGPLKTARGVHLVATSPQHYSAGQYQAIPAVNFEERETKILFRDGRPGFRWAPHQRFVFAKPRT